MAHLSAHPKSTHARTKARINSKLENKIAAYMAVAGATGITLAALAQPAEAKIIYTPANISVVPDVSIPIDFNHDGVTDVYVSYFNSVYIWGMRGFVPAGNGVKVKAAGYRSALALFFGAPIGPAAAFAPGSQSVFMASCAAKSSFSGCGGPWDNAGTKYLGVKFQISGQTHYGWVRIDATNLEGVITGYAYESTPNTLVEAGHLHPGAIGSVSPSTESAPSRPAPRASLGHLALGSRGLSAWRRNEEPVK